ncbi:MAG TPA: Hsp20/alpha crystallin family protein [Alphaproteobacteria bacterium]
MARTSKTTTTKPAAKTGAKPAARRKRAAPKAEVPAAARKAEVPAVRSVFDQWLQLRNEVDRVFENFTAGFRFPGFASRMFDLEAWPLPRLLSQQLLMRTDLSETDKAVELRAELPGLTEADIDVTVSDDVLTVTGKKQEEREERGKEFHLRERSFGSFKRSFRLPAGVDASKISAAFDKGVLTVTVPKPERPKAPRKKIAVARKA